MLNSFQAPNRDKIPTRQSLKQDASFYLLMVIELSMGKNISTLDALM